MQIISVWKFRVICVQLRTLEQMKRCELQSTVEFSFTFWYTSHAHCAVLCFVVSDSLRPHGLACQAPLSVGILNTRMGCHALLQGIFPTQRLNPGFPHCRQILYHLSHKGSPKLLLRKHSWNKSCLGMMYFLIAWFSFLISAETYHLYVRSV